MTLTAFVCPDGKGEAGAEVDLQQSQTNAKGETALTQFARRTYPRRALRACKPVCTAKADAKGRVLVDDANEDDCPRLRRR